MGCHCSKADEGQSDSKSQRQKRQKKKQQQKNAVQLMGKRNQIQATEDSDNQCLTDNDYDDKSNSTLKNIKTQARNQNSFIELDDFQ